MLKKERKLESVRKITQESTQKGLKEKSAQESTLGTAKKVIVKKIAEKRDRKRAQNRPKKLKVAMYKKITNKPLPAFNKNLTRK